MTQRTTERKNRIRGTGASTRRAQDADNGLRDPGKMDYDEADRVLKRIVRENAAWFKEMAKR